MILQNISKAIREQNYYAVALEFVIVIAGVVIGFQIQAWNEGRADREAEALYLTTLAGELDLISTRLQEGIDSLVEHHDYAVLFLEAAEAGDFESAQEREPVFGVIAVTRVVSEELVPASLNELLSSGRLPIIQSSELRNELAGLPMTDKGLQVLTEQLQIQQSQIVDSVSRRVITGSGSNWLRGFHFTGDESDQVIFRQLHYATYLNTVNARNLRTYRDRVIDIKDMVCAEVPAATTCQELVVETQAQEP